MEPIIIRGKKIGKPIIQGGMGVGVSMSGLASAVINQGGVGTISVSQIGFYKDDFFHSARVSNDKNMEAIKEQVAKTRKLTNNKGFLAVNILTASRQYANLAKASVESGVDAIISGAGLPIDLPKYTQGTDTANIPIVANSRVLNIIMRKWVKKYGVIPDAVVVEGPEAGGHLGIKYDDIGKENNEDNLDSRVRDVKEWCEKNGYDFPIFAAGGIFTNEDYVNIRKAGADGVQIGTRFIATEECDAHENFKKKFIEAKEEDIVYVKSPVGYPARAIRNEFTEQLEEGFIKPEKCIGCVSPCKGVHETTPYCISDYLVRSVTGDARTGLVFTGANGFRIEKITTVKDVMKDILGE